MTQNRRYRTPLDDNLARTTRQAELRGTSIGLSSDELRISGRRVEARTAVPVQAWVRHRVIYEEPRLVEGEAIAWTDRAVLIRWTDTQNTNERLTWVWADAVRRR